jgi:hypothetical protein
VDDFTLGVLLVTERDDRGLTTTRVGTEFRVDVSLDGRGDRLGLRARKSKTSSSVIALERHHRERNKEERIHPRTLAG